LKTEHLNINSNAREMTVLADNSINLVITSPPYPMIKLWDDLFIKEDPEIKTLLDSKHFTEAFERMHCQLDQVWQEIFRVVQDGSHVCINIGDALRSGANGFQVFANSARIITFMQNIGFQHLPSIIWRKPTNAPNKFMGSGMLPCGAYVTLEHENILLFRKGSKRIFSDEESRHNRLASALFWEERNNWFSDLWNITGARQVGDCALITRRTAAFPPAIPYRLINMYSVYSDTVMDPFHGTGTTMLMAMAAARNSVGFEQDKSCWQTAAKRIEIEQNSLNGYSKQRLEQHTKYVKEREEKGVNCKYENKHYGFPVVTRQEVDLIFKKTDRVIETHPGKYIVQHSNMECYNNSNDY